MASLPSPTRHAEGEEEMKSKGREDLVLKSRTISELLCLKHTVQQTMETPVKESLFSS